MADDEEVPSAAGKRSRIPKSANMPSATPEATRKVVEALVQFAGPASRERLASHMGVQLTGNVARALSSALLYGFIAIDPDKKLIVTDRGHAFAGTDAEAAKRAAREAIMASSFGLVVKRLTTRKADADIIAVRMQEDQGLGDAAARDRSKLLVKAATTAGLVINGNFDGGVIEDTIAVVGDPSEVKSDSPAADNAASKVKARGAEAGASPMIQAKPKESKSSVTTSATRGGKDAGNPGVPFAQAAAPLQVVLQIDASKLDAAQIGEIVRELRASVAVSTDGF